MERKVRNRMNKNDAQLMLIKLLPLMFLILLFLVSTGIAVGIGADGPAGSVFD